MTYDYRKFYIDGRWVDPVEPRDFTVIDPASEAPAGLISLGSAQDVDRAVAAARGAFESFAETTREERRALLESCLAVYKKRYQDIADAMRTEMGAPAALAKGAQAGIGVGHLSAMIELLKTFRFEERRGPARLELEPVGVCALITPWNWPMNQVAAKVVPALAAGCTMVLKPSEFSPFSAAIWTEVLHEAGVPAGAALAGHPQIDMVSFTGSTRAGTEVARIAAATVKRVHQELGGKSPDVLLEDADFERAVKATVQHVFENSGQSCNAPTRLLVPAARLAEVEALAKKTAEAVVVGDPASEKTQVGPVVSKTQFDRVQGYIAQGIAEGAKLVTGGVGRPAGLEKGYYVRPTIFSQVRNDMTIAREEIFGPVLTILPYRDEAEAIRIANDTPYGLHAYVWSRDLQRANSVGRKIRAGRVTINGAPGDMSVPFGGFKRSGNGREWGEYGLRDFLEVKAVLGAEAQTER
jgi:aldehyde dehydrogenase (NAD+)